MPRQDQLKSVVFFSQTGCLLPLLIMLNLFFGWMFIKPLAWLLVEGVLILLFLLNSLIITRKIKSFTPGRADVIDVEGKVIDEKKSIDVKSK